MDWVLVALAHEFKFQNGVNADRSAYGSGIPFANVLEVITHKVLSDAHIPGRVTLPEAVAASFVVRPGDVLFNRTSETQHEVGLASVFSGEQRTVFGGFVIRGSPRAGRLLPGFASHVLRAPSVRAQIVARGQGVVRANIGQADLSRVVVPLPGAAEQGAIADALSDTDALIESLEQLLVKKRQIKQGAMQELLTCQRRLPGFAEQWRTARLGDVSRMRSGEAITSEDIDDHSPYPCYGGNGLRGFCDRYTHDGTFVLIGRQGALCGNVGFVEGQFFASEHAIVVTVSNHVDARWLAFVLVRMNLNQYSESSAQPGLSAVKLLQLEVRVPVLSEQTAIATTLVDMDAELAALEARLAKTRLLKQGMAQALLTGRIRLV